jgi:ATP-dependent 26S proteasome regulatory subunit
MTAAVVTRTLPRAVPYASARDHLDDHVTILRQWIRATQEGDASPRWTAIDQANDLMSARANVSALGSTPLRHLQRALGLAPTELRVLVLLAGVELDVSLRRELAAIATTNNLADVGSLVTLLCRSREERAAADGDLGPDGTLTRFALIHIEARSDVPRMLRAVRLDDRVLALLCGQDRPDPVLAAMTTMPGPVDERALVLEPTVSARVRALVGAATRDPGAPAPLVTGPAGVGRRSVLVAALGALGYTALVVNVARLPRDATALRDVGRRLHREAVLAHAVVVLDGLDRFAGEVPLDEALFDGDAPTVAATAGRIAGQAPQLGRGVVRVDLDVPDESARERLWRAYLPHAAAPDLARWAAERYRVTPGVIRAAAVAALSLARARSGDGAAVDLMAPDLHEGLRSVLDAKLATLGTRITWRQQWDDLVLPDDAIDDIIEFVARVRHRRQVYEVWGLGRKVAKGMGLSALFSGPPGTGKTMVAGLIAHELGLDVYQIDLSKVVSKWIGETEKNLGELFDAAEAGHAILLFDEADSLFARRTSVQSSNDRNANLEVNYLLQRLEAFAGIVILTTNHDTAIDDAFRRRLSLRVEFPVPDEAEREKLWAALVGGDLPREPGVDVADLARRFAMTGGYIKNATVRAAFLAAHEGTAVGMRHLLRAARSEYRAMGKVVTG